MAKLLVVLLALVACKSGGDAPNVQQPTNTTAVGKAATRNGLFVIEVDRLGPLDKHTPANLTALRELFSKGGFTVTPVNNAGVEYHVFKQEELLFYVIPSDDGTLFNVHVTSPKVVIAQHPEWVIGSPFKGDDILTDCECWGEHPMCFKKGEHVAVGFRRGCDGLDDANMRRVLMGVTIQRAVWSPYRFGYDEERPGMEVPSDPCGGSDGWTDPCGAGIPVPDPCGGNPCGP